MIEREDYCDATVTLDAEVATPSYGQCLEWMKAQPDDAPPTFDYWARGNYTRRLLHNRAIGRHPLVVEVRRVDQMRWAFRRLALLGLPVDFLYRGSLTKPLRLLHMLPIQEDTVFDSGWGYIGTLCDDIGGQRFATLIGTARLMPRPLFRWLVEEASDEFVRGDVFIAPAQLVGAPGIPAPDHVQSLADVAVGTPVTSPFSEARAALSIDLPFVDGMTSEDFRALLRDEEEALTDFRAAFTDLCRSDTSQEGHVKLVVARLQDEVARIVHSARFQRMRDFATRCRGRVGTFEMLVSGLAAGGALYAQDPFAGSAVVAGAGKVLHDLWRQSRSLEPDLGGHRLRLFWKLGVQRLRTENTQRFALVRRAQRKRAQKIDPHHWLCPPSAGIGFLCKEKESS